MGEALDEDSRVEGLGFRGGLVFSGHRWLHDSTLGSRVAEKRKIRGEYLTKMEGSRGLDPIGP